ncbi:hypothetical protein JL720_822 [Aureococcus anophagefferens]|nr:hypothetical protein JL720_822 [Aureococcus anophagefferens]
MCPAPHADDRSDPDLAEAAREAALIAEENRILNSCADTARFRSRSRPMETGPHGTAVKRPRAATMSPPVTQRPIPRRPRAESDFVLSTPRRKLIEVKTDWLPAHLAPSAIPRLSVALETCGGAASGRRRRVSITCDRRRAAVSVGAAPRGDGRVRGRLRRVGLLHGAPEPPPRQGPRPLHALEARRARLRRVPAYRRRAATSRFYQSAAYLDRHAGGALRRPWTSRPGPTSTSAASPASPSSCTLHVATVLADLRMDGHGHGGLLHDTVEDTSLTVGDIQATFGDAVARIVEGVTDEPSQIDSENQQDLLLSMSSEWRVALVKLADRLHNMRTLKHMPKEKRIKKAKETMELFVPLARKMGITPI